jgi:glycosyltransferase involved in cell wall biosynthesis
LNVKFFDQHMNRSEVTALLTTADCYVSLHRCEGLGLGMAQAMALGKPVIATGYSGNLEYMTRENSFLVDFRMIEIDKPYGSYAPACRWAEPDLDQAAALMRWVEAHREEAALIGARARRDVLDVLNPSRCIAAIRKRAAALTQTREPAVASASSQHVWPVSPRRPTN